MDGTSTKRRFYATAISLILFLGIALFNKMAVQSDKNDLLREKYNEIINHVNILAITIDAEVERNAADYEYHIRGASEYIDKLYQVYCGAYRLRTDEDGVKELELITDRFYETSTFEPTEYDEFIELVFKHESGGIVINYAPENQTRRDLHIYFRWIPTSTEVAERYLVVAGVSVHSITATAPLWRAAGQWITLLALLSLCGWYIYELIMTHYERKKQWSKWERRGAKAREEKI